jgi:non-heme chloroperoxidase
LASPAVCTKTSQGLLDAFWLQGMLGALKGQLDCIRQFSEVDYTEDFKKIDVPTLFIHGDDDQMVPIDTSSMRSSKIVKNAMLKVYPGASHGLTSTHRERFNDDLLAFIDGYRVYLGMVNL